MRNDTLDWYDAPHDTPKPVGEIPKPAPQEPALPIEEKFLLWLDDEGDFTIQSQKQSGLVAHGENPTEAVRIMGTILSMATKNPQKVVDKSEGSLPSDFVESFPQPTAPEPALDSDVILSGTEFRELIAASQSMPVRPAWSNTHPVGRQVNRYADAIEAQLLASQAEVSRLKDALVGRTYADAVAHVMSTFPFAEAAAYMQSVSWQYYDGPVSEERLRQTAESLFGHLSDKGTGIKGGGLSVSLRAMQNKCALYLRFDDVKDEEDETPARYWSESDYNPYLRTIDSVIK